MKKLSLLVSGILVSGMALGQGTELFISEVIEGAGAGENNKAIEIFNPTNQVVDISQYSIRRYSNGNSTWTAEERLTADAGAANNLISPQDVYVVVNPDANAPDIVSAADQLSGPHPGSGGGTAPNTILGGGVVYANGNDAYALVRWYGGAPGAPGASFEIVDIFGKIGEDPGTSTGWAGVQSGNPSTISSANHSLVRKPTVSAGVTDENAPFDITAEWRAYSAFDAAATPTQDFSQLGQHADYAGPTGNYVTGVAADVFSRSISLYPNPATDRVLASFEENTVGSFTIVNALGQQLLVSTANLSGQSAELNTSNLASGLYFVKFMSKDGSVGILKSLVIQ